MSDKSTSVDTLESNKRVHHWIVAGAFFTFISLESRLTSSGKA